MRILMVLDHEFPSDIRVENEIETLITAGYDVHLACYTREKRAFLDTFGKAIIHRKSISKFIYKSSVACLKFSFYFNFWRSFLESIFKETDFDAIQIHDLPLAKVGHEFSQKYKTQFILDLHENWPALLTMAKHTNTLLGKLLSNNKQWKNYEIDYCKKADRIIVVVEESKQRLIVLNIQEQKIFVVSNTLNFKHFNLPETKPDANYVTLFYAGGITQHRGLQYVIEGLKYLKAASKPIRFWVLGTGSYINNLKKIAKQNEVENLVSFEGWRSYSEMQLFLGKADICLIPHVKSDHTDSTIPHKLFQYMYAGKPTIASDCSPIERILSQEACGFTYPYSDSKAFADRVKELMDNKGLMENMSEKGILAVEKTFNWEIESRKLLKIYSDKK
ncbi:MAG: glycosyltransferase family 4 protein [Bacteroidales bacterium]|nr:glycosyltransferase family 4 protein [Bacteroidales bacterium]